MKFISFAAGLAAMATQAYALFDEVEQLTTENFEQMVLDDDENMWIVAFYADWCPYCKPFEPEYAAAKADPKMADKKIKFAAIDVMANRETTQKYGISRSPTVKIFGKDKSAPVDYENARKKIEIVTYLNDYAISNDFIVKAEKAQYLYNIDAIIKTISTDHDIRIAEADKKHKEELVELAKELGQQTNDTKKLYEDKLEELRKVGEEMIANAAIQIEDEVAQKKSSQQQVLDDLDRERRDIIQDIDTKDRENIELSDYIKTVDQDWFDIKWSSDNQLPKSRYTEPEKDQSPDSPQSLYMQPQTPSYQQPQSSYQQPQRSYQQPQSYQYQQQQRQQPQYQKLASVPYSDRTYGQVRPQSQQQPRLSQYGAQQQQIYIRPPQQQQQKQPYEHTIRPPQQPKQQRPQYSSINGAPISKKEQYQLYLEAKAAREAQTKTQQRPQKQYGSRPPMRAAPRPSGAYY